MKALRRIAVALTAAALMTVLMLAASSAQEGQRRHFNAPAQQQQAGGADWKAVGQALGKEGSMQPGDVYKVSLPRSDLQITAGGVRIKPALALGSWVAFKRMGDAAMVMGDIVLTEDEVTPVMTKLQE